MLVFGTPLPIGSKFSTKKFEGTRRGFFFLPPFLSLTPPKDNERGEEEDSELERETLNTCVDTSM